MHRMDACNTLAGAGIEGMSISAMGMSIGGFLLPLLCGVLLAEYDWRTTFLYLALLALLLICPFSCLVLRRNPPVAPPVELH
jgi:MFS family permease